MQADGSDSSVSTLLIDCFVEGMKVVDALNHPSKKTEWSITLVMDYMKLGTFSDRVAGG